MVQAGGGYIAVTFTGSFTLIFYFVNQAIFRGAGDAFTPMIIIAITAILNIVLDPLLIFGLWVFPALGVTGAALATTIARGIGLGVSGYYLFRRDSPLPLSWKIVRLEKEIFWRLLVIGFPGSAEAGVRNLVSVLLMKIISFYGTIAVAAYGVGLGLDTIAMMPGWALGNSAATLVGQNLGADKKARAAWSAWLVTSLYLCIMLLLGTTFFLWAEPIIRIFNTHPEVVRVGVEYIRIITPSYPFLALSMVLSRGLGGAGDTVSPLVITCLALFGILLPCSFVLPQFFSLGTKGIWLAIAMNTVFQGRPSGSGFYGENGRSAKFSILFLTILKRST